MTAFVESCVETITDSAKGVERRTRRHPKAKQLLKLLTGKKNILITTHKYPDPDALASSLALCKLLAKKLDGAKVSVSIKGRIVGGMNNMFAEQADLELVPWHDADLGGYDAIVLLDTQPHFANTPLPPGVVPDAIIDHHRSLRRRPKKTAGFVDVRPEVGATASLIFSYYMELEEDISRDLAATLLYAIESDLAGTAGKPGELDNIALSSLTLLANTRMLYEMRYVDLPQNYYIAYANGLNNATFYDHALVSHLGEIDTPEKPAIIADFLLRFDQVDWALITATLNGNLVISLRTRSAKRTAADTIRRLLRNLGEGGGHRTKAGGYIKLADPTSAAEVERHRNTLRRRYLRALHITSQRPQRLVPKVPAKA